MGRQMTQIECPKCNKLHKISGDAPIGKSANCVACKQSFVVTSETIRNSELTPIVTAESSPKLSKKAEAKIKLYDSAMDLIDYFVLVLVILVSGGLAGLVIFVRPVDANELSTIATSTARLSYLAEIVVAFFVIRGVVRATVKAQEESRAKKTKT